MASPERRLFSTLLVAAAVASAALLAQTAPLPNRSGSLKFAAIGDNGTGDRPQYEVGAADGEGPCRRSPSTSSSCWATTCTAARAPADFVKKFEQPYAPLLAAGVKFQASLGNHDRPEQVIYKPYNMNGQRYYTLRPQQRPLLRARQHPHGPRSSSSGSRPTLRDAREDWKICYFHHPLYSNAARHGSSVDLRVLLEPIFVKYGVNVVFSGHDHVYERLKPQKGIYYFVSGAAGQLRRGNMRRVRTRPPRRSIRTRASWLVEIAGAEMFFQVDLAHRQDRRFRRDPPAERRTR